MRARFWLILLALAVSASGGAVPVARILGTSAHQKRPIRVGDFRSDQQDLFSVAVAYGVATSARTITSAALIMIAVFTGFAVSGSVSARAEQQAPAVEALPALALASARER